MKKQVAETKTMPIKKRERALERTAHSSSIVVLLAFFYVIGHGFCPVPLLFFGGKGIV